MKRVPLPAGLWLLLSFIALDSMGFYTFRIWSANQPAGFSDLYAPWWAAHEMLLHRRNPYSPEVTREIQSVIYGPSFAAAEDPAKLGGGFAYPAYVALLLWPIIQMPFPAAQKVFAGVSILATLLSVALWARAIELRPPPLTRLTIVFFTLGSFPVLQGIHLENLSLLAAALIALAIFLISIDHLGLAGVFLALSTFKPQFIILLIPWLLVWSLSGWRRRRAMAITFLVTMLLLIFISEWLAPGWISSFVSIVRAYRHYTFGRSVLDLWFTPGWGRLAAALLVLTALGITWRYRSHAADSRPFLSVVCLLLALTLVVIPTLAPHAQILLLPGFLSLIRSRNLPGAGCLAKTSFAAAWLLLAWPWIATLGLSLMALRVPIANLYPLWQIPLFTSPLLPVVLGMATGLLLRLMPGQELSADG